MNRMMDDMEIHVGKSKTEYDSGRLRRSSLQDLKLEDTQQNQNLGEWHATYAVGRLLSSGALVVLSF